MQNYKSPNVIFQICKSCDRFHHTNMLRCPQRVNP